MAPPGDSGSCTFYDLPYYNLTDDVILEWKWDDHNPYKRNETPTLECDQWIYDQSFFQSSAVTKVGEVGEFEEVINFRIFFSFQFDLVCGGELLSSGLSSIFLLGILLGSSVCGFLSDKLVQFNYFYLLL